MTCRNRDRVGLISQSQRRSLAEDDPQRQRLVDKRVQGPRLPSLGERLTPDDVQEPRSGGPHQPVATTFPRRRRPAAAAIGRQTSPRAAPPKLGRKTYA